MAKENSLIDEVLNRVDIIDVVGRYVPLRRAGGNFAGCCPFHNEKTPSFLVSQSKQIFKCFGCGAWGGVFKFIQEIEKIDFWDAVRFLAEQEHIDITMFQTGVSPERYQHHQDEKEKLKRIHKLTQEFFVENLHNSPTALNYLKEKRKLNDKIISDFWIWFAPDKNYELLQYLRSKWFIDGDILQASLAKKSANSADIFAFFKNRITFPIYDQMKNVVGFTARVLNPEDQPKYLNSSEHKIFNKSKILYWFTQAKAHLNEMKKLILVEGQMDVIGLARLGFPIGVASSWTAFTEEHVQLIKRHIDELYLLFDNDTAGQQATIRALKLCYQQDLFPKIISLPQEIEWIKIKDADDIANLANGQDLFNWYFNNAQDGFLVIFNRLRVMWDMNSPVDKQKLINMMFELILCVQNLTIQEHYKILLAEKLGFAPEILDAQFKRFKVWEGKFLIRQMEKQTNNQDMPENKYKIDREQLFSSLFVKQEWETFLSKNLSSENDFLENLNDFTNLIIKAVSDSLLAKVISWEIEEDKKNELLEFQLFWEKEFWETADQKMKKLVIQKTILPTNPWQPSPIMDYIKQAQKSLLLSPEEKMELNRLRVELGKG